MGSHHQVHYQIHSRSNLSCDPSQSSSGSVGFLLPMPHLLLILTVLLSREHLLSPTCLPWNVDACASLCLSGSVPEVNGRTWVNWVTSGAWSLTVTSVLRVVVFSRFLYSVLFCFMCKKPCSHTAELAGRESTRSMSLRMLEQALPCIIELISTQVSVGISLLKGWKIWY